jgi:GNAT superfamily N-acetyltransferase
MELEIEGARREHLAGVRDLFMREGWRSYAADQERTWRALSAPGTIALVARQRGRVVGVAQTLSDGEIQAFLTVLLIAEEHRGAGVGRTLLERIAHRTPGVRLDLISCADGFYGALGMRRVSGFRLSRERGAE